MGWDTTVKKDVKEFLLGDADRVTVSYARRENGTFYGELCATVDRSTLWKCDHDHTKPEHNASYRGERYKIWEASALKCSMIAYDEFYNRREVGGYAGMIGDTVSDVSYRADCASAYFDLDKLSVAHARLVLFDGVRWMFLWKGSTGTPNLIPTQGMSPLGGQSWFGAIRLDHFDDATYIPAFEDAQDQTMFIQAATHFAADAHGMMFKHDHAPSVIQNHGSLKREKLLARIEKAVVKASNKKSDVKPNIKVKEYALDSRLEGGVKKFVLISPDGEEIEEHYRRGTAVRSLMKHNKGL